MFCIIKPSLHPQIPLQVMLEVVHCRRSMVLRISEGARLAPYALCQLLLEHLAKLSRRAKPRLPVGIIRTGAGLDYEPHGLYVELRGRVVSRNVQFQRSNEDWAGVRFGGFMVEIQGLKWFCKNVIPGSNKRYLIWLPSVRIM